MTAARRVRVASCVKLDGFRFIARPTRRLELREGGDPAFLVAHRFGARLRDQQLDLVELGLEGRPLAFQADRQLVDGRERLGCLHVLVVDGAFARGGLVAGIDGRVGVQSVSPPLRLAQSSGIRIQPCRIA
jgi:hypothetical protein